MTNFFGEALILSMLDIPKVGTKTVERLLRLWGPAFNECESNIDAIVKKMSENGIEVSTAVLMQSLQKYLYELREWAEQGIYSLGYWNPQFPHNLRTIPDPPVHLFVKGDVKALSLRSVAVVGTRAPTRFGSLSARKIAYRLASKKITVISGLAEGCDTEAHEGCLEGGGQTVAVLAHGFGKIYPASNASLADRILQTNGVLISEYRPNTPPLRGSFVRRDRLQSGLSQLVIVVETGVKGGTMHTVGFATKQGRLLAAIDHPQRWLDHEKVQGNQLLISTHVAAPLRNLSDLWRLIEGITGGI